MTTLSLSMTTTPTPVLAQFLSGGGYAGVMIVGLIILIVLLLAGLASVGGLIYIWIRALTQPHLAQGLANCGRCGYSVRGAASMACPECGADFREVGIKSPAMRKPFIGAVLFIVLWSLCLWMPGCVVSSVAISVGPQQHLHSDSVDLNPPDTNAAGYDNVMLNQSPYGMYGNWTLELFPQQSRYIDVDIYGPNGNEWYEVDISNNTFQDYSGSTANPVPFDRATLERWIATTGGDTSNADVQAQIDQIYNNIQQAQTQGLASANWSAFKVNSQSNWSDSQPAGWFVMIQPVFWILVYALGIVIFFILRNRYNKAMATLLANQPIATDPYATLQPPTPSP